MNLVRVPRTRAARYKSFAQSCNTFMKIAYTVPQKGRVLFKVFNVNGQLLSRYSTFVENPLMTNSYSINTSGLVEGNYILMMEMKGRSLKNIVFVK